MLWVLLYHSAKPVGNPEGYMATDVNYVHGNFYSMAHKLIPQLTCVKKMNKSWGIQVGKHSCRVKVCPELAIIKQKWV